MTMKKRMLALVIALALMIVGTIAYVVIAGDVCTVKMVHTLIYDLDADQINVQIDDPSVAEVVDIEIIDVDDLKTAAITFGSLEPGDTTARVYYNFSDKSAEEETAEETTAASEEAATQEESTDEETEASAEERTTEPAEEKTDEQSAQGSMTEMSPELYLHVNFIGTIFEEGDLTFNGWQIVMIEVLVFLLLVSGLMIWSFVECWRNAWYSYSMVAYGGIAAFCFFTVLNTVVDLPGIRTLQAFLQGIADSGYWFAMITAPFMLVLCGAFVFSNIWLMRHEGRRPQNMLGIGLAVGWIVILAISLNAAYFFVRIEDFNIMDDISYCFAYLLTFLECMLLSTIVCAFLSTTNQPSFDKDYIIILGCGINRDGSLTPLLKGRVDEAIRFERKQFAHTGKHAIFIPSGGQGDDEVMSESEAMARYLLQQGYPVEQIIMEDESTNTDENFELSCDKIWEDSGTVEGIRAAFATTNYHVFRGYTLAEKHGLDVEGISAKTKWYFYPNAFLREFAGLLMNKKVRIGIFFGLIMLVFLAGAHLLNLR